MTDTPANLLCKACGLCCSGHLFSWVRLNAPELDPVEKLGIKVIRNDPRQRGFLQPCSMWQSTCVIYASPDYPRSCKKFNCQVLRRLQDDDISFPEAMAMVAEILELIREIESILPESANESFRERMIAQKERLEIKPELLPYEEELLSKTRKLLDWYIYRFGVDEFLDYEN
ncbi:MAG: hypothetical protein KDD74_18205 [Anaerolineales bacterium]|nr:hypothetical protein [Anaerolineales bacterium]